MCSVLRCESGRRGAQRFKLPEDPERRLEWVQFLAAANKQRFKESSWTDITICSEHFKDVCLDHRTPTRPGVTGQLALNPGAVPSLQPGEAAGSRERAEPEETTEVACLRDQIKTCDGPTAFSEESMAVGGNLVPRGALCSADAADALGSCQMQPKHLDFDLIGKKAALLQMKGKYVVKERLLLQLFSHTCPSCGCKVKMEKVTCGLLITLNQHCLQCGFRNQWKSQVDAGVPTDEDQHLTEVEVPPEAQQAVPSGGPAGREIVSVIDEQSEPIHPSSDPGDVDSDEDWKPLNGSSHARVLVKKPEEETEEEEEEEDDDEEEDEEQEEDGDYPPLPVKHSRLCTECGVLYNKQRPHTCEHKVKPCSCNICGKRCVSEKALITHSRIHDENYEYQCKYCHVTFKTKVDKITHEQIHVVQGKPYKCPDCSETFATNKERRLHLEDHRGPQQLQCHICGIDFLWPLSLQRHLAVHTGERPFKCSVCQRGFKQAGHLKSHMRLHTGERPFKCPHCDKRFNHNVSLKSHVQRHHSSGAGRERRREKVGKRTSVAGDAQDEENQRGADSGLDNVEDEQDTEEEAHRGSTYRAKKKSTGRPIGRPKRHEPDHSEEGQPSHAKSGKLQTHRSKKTQRRGGGGEAKPSDSSTSCEEEEEEEEGCGKATKSTARSRGRPTDSDSDCDFDPEERKKKRYSSGKSSGKRRGRPRRNPADDA